MATLKGQAEQAEAFARQAVLASNWEQYDNLMQRVHEIVLRLDTHRMRTNSVQAHRNWERAYNASRQEWIG